MKMFVTLGMALVFARIAPAQIVTPSDPTSRGDVSAQENAVPFVAGSTGRLFMDSSNFIWDNTPGMKRFRIGPRAGFKDATFPYILNNTQHTIGSINQGKKFPMAFAVLSEDDDPSAAIAAAEVDVVSRHSTGYKSDVTGFEADVYNDSTGTVNVAYPFAAYTEVNAGTVNNAVGMVVFGTYKAPGATLWNNIGIQVLDQDMGANNFAIKTGKGRLEFGDYVELDPVADPPCTANRYFFWASASAKKMKKCENGVVSDM